MGRATQIAKDEADAVEAEEPDAEPGAITEDAYADGAEPPEPDDGPSLDAQEKALERELTRHAEVIAELLGDGMADYEPCEQCAMVGFKPRLPFKRDASLVMCSTCDGHGYLVTGSLNPDKAVRMCLFCQGDGFVAKPYEPPPEQQQQAYYPPPQNGGPLPAPPYVPQSPPAGGAPGWAPGYTPPAQPFPGGS